LQHHTLTRTGDTFTYDLLSACTPAGVSDRHTSFGASATAYSALADGLSSLTQLEVLTKHPRTVVTPTSPTTVSSGSGNINGNGNGNGAAAASLPFVRLPDVWEATYSFVNGFMREFLRSRMVKSLQVG
jgi:hypothetical protein